MERIQALINRLQEQANQHADIAQLQATLQLIQAELNLKQHSAGKTLGTSKISVVMPASPMTVTAVPEPILEKEAPKETVKETTAYSYPKVRPKNTNQLDLHFDPMNEIPTFSQYKSGTEINESVAQTESLNDKLKEDKTELMHVLKETPIRDLRKGIGINDRFVFINELFRGDEAMYERSIKTINSFNILPEAEYWMNRELQIKLGWDDSKEIVKHFFQLVRRRFA